MAKRGIIFLRGPSAVGKTAVATSLLLHIKNNLRKNCAFISEDNFRKKMQFKYKAEDKKAHINSAHLLIAVINELTSIDSYDFIVIEGLFRYKEMINEYNAFCKGNEFEAYWFQLESPLKVRKERNKLSNIRDHVSDLKTSHGTGKGEEIALNNSIIVDTTKPITQSVKLIIDTIRTL